MENKGNGMAKAGKRRFQKKDPYHFSFYPGLMPLVLICILFNAIVGSIPAVFMRILLL